MLVILKKIEKSLYNKSDIQAKFIKKNKSQINFECVDYNPSRCKDYHENGYCTWGNTCIYSHDRTNYSDKDELKKTWDKISEKTSKFKKYIKK